MILIFNVSNMCTDIWKQKKIVVILEVKFHHEQVLSKTIIFTISLDWGLVLPFLNIDHDFGNVTFFGTISGSYSWQIFNFCWLGGFIEWATIVYFWPIFVLFKTLLNLLTCSVLLVEWMTKTESAISGDSTDSMKFGPWGLNTM